MSSLIFFGVLFLAKVQHAQHGQNNLYTDYKAGIICKDEYEKLCGTVKEIRVNEKENCR